MNPYVYRRKAYKLSKASAVQPGELLGLFKSVFVSPISSAVAFAAVVFAATSVGVISFAAHAEMSANIYEPPVRTVHLKPAAHSVLGTVTSLSAYPETVVTSKNNAVVKITARPVEFESGAWRYELAWSRARKADGSIYINGAALAATAPQQGQAKVELKPKTRTKVEFYSRPNKQGTLLVRKYFTTLPSPDEPVACTQEAKLCPDGKTYVGRKGPACEFEACPASEAELKVLLPSAGAAWKIGTNYNIKWSAPATVSRVDIYLQDAPACLESSPACAIPQRAPVLIARDVAVAQTSASQGYAMYAWKAGSLQGEAGEVAAPGRYKVVIKVTVGKELVGTSAAFSLESQPLAVCDYAAPPVGCEYVKGPAYNEQTACGMVLKCAEAVTSTPSSAASFRYLKVNTVNSRSWVAWREIEVYGEDGKKITPADVTAQYTWRNYPADGQDHGPKLAVDGNVNSVWNAGETAPNCNWFGVGYSDRIGCAIGNQSAWIQLDLGSVKKVSKIKLLTENTPNPASATHQLLTSSEGKDYTKLHEFAGDIKSNTWLVYPPEK